LLVSEIRGTQQRPFFLRTLGDSLFTLENSSSETMLAYPK
jgi:hypothetical protein